MSYRPRHRRPKLKEAIEPLGGLVRGVHEPCRSVPPIDQVDYLTN